MSNIDSQKEPVTQASEEAKAVVELWENAYNNCPHYPGSGTRACECKVCLEEMISHALDRVSRQALERAATLIDSECARVLTKQTAGRTDALYEYSVNLNIRMMVVLLPDLAAAIRGLSDGESVASAEKEE